MRRLSPLVALFLVCVLALAGPKVSDDWAPAWAPERQGRSLIAFEAFVGDVSDIYLMEVDDGLLMNITQGAFRDTSPSFSPDGSKVAFASLREGSWKIFIRDLPQRKGG